MDFSNLPPIAWIMLLLALVSLISIPLRIIAWRSRPHPRPAPGYRTGCVTGVIFGVAIGICIGLVLEMYLQAHPSLFR